MRDRICVLIVCENESMVVKGGFPVCFGEITEACSKFLNRHIFEESRRKKRRREEGKQAKESVKKRAGEKMGNKN